MIKTCRSALWWWWPNHGEHKLGVDAENWSIVVEANFGMKRSGENVVKSKVGEISAEGSNTQGWVLIGVTISAWDLFSKCLRVVEKWLT
ncbi:hypothetical protein YC2023_083246 [Brassica napus]